MSSFYWEMYFHISISTFDGVALPERISGSTELPLTFSTMFSVLQAFVVIAKLSRRKTEIFLNFF